jgi:polar amino acid transport system permease protein
VNFSGFLGHAREYLPILLGGAWITVKVTLTALVLATLLGLVIALARTQSGRGGGGRVLGFVAASWVNVVRGIPIIVLLFYIYFVLPDVGIDLNAFQAGVIGLGITYSAYMSEVFRAGILAVDPGQMEAAASIGMSGATTLRRVVLPQAWRVALPPYGNNLIMLLKDSSQTSAITVAELATQSKLIASSTFRNMEVFTLAAILYLVMSVPLILLVGRLETVLRRR